MGGWMTYGRMRNRNGLDWRPEADPETGRYADPYPRLNEQHSMGRYHLVLGDMNRMEQDYLHPEYPQDVSDHFASRPRGSSPAEECATATGVSLEDVRKVLHYVFRESR